MLENSGESYHKPCNNGSSDSSDCEDEPVVKRKRKTLRRVVDPAEILSTNQNQANVYTTVAQKSFEEIHSSKFDFAKYCQEEKVEIEKEEKFKQLKNTFPSEIQDDVLCIESNCSSSGFQPVSFCRSQSPAPPSPPPPVVANPVRTRSFSKITQNLKKIQSSIQKLDKVLNSDPCDIQCLDDSVIIVDDDDKEEENITSSPDAFSREIVVMVKIGSEIKRFPMNKTDTFCNLFSYLAQEKKVPDTRLMLLLNEKTIHQNETPASIQLQVADIIDCLITEEEDPEEFSERTGPNVISLVIQSSINQKSKKTMRIGKFEMLQGIIDLYAKQHKLQAADLKLRFDGEIVDTSQTPADLDMEDEDSVIFFFHNYTSR
ncbi:unnamed protein product [Acanthosepion pharaonis]|uniref:Rad60/SUMO-like domain-containing protein n=1 Tax=Acanthosepion pharaonis TaxID=158019 RepID=A0A812D174_ACAPH|nr:unnamed protein product [Sepia pharaonis]